MSKVTITRWWISGAALLAVAAILLVGGGVALLARLDRPAGGGEVAPGAAEARVLVALVGLGCAVAAAGVVAELVAWTGALVNTYPLADRRWFGALAWCGAAGIVTLPLFGLGAAIGGGAMLAYLVGGPAEARTRSVVWPKARIVRLSSAGLVPMALAFVGSLLVARLTNPGGLLHAHQSLAVGLLAASVALAFGGVVAEVAAWWAALFNARRLVDQTWFRVLLATGVAAALTMPLLGLGAFIAMAVGIAYRIAAPDSTAAYDSFPPDAASGGAHATTEVTTMASRKHSSTAISAAGSRAFLRLRDIPATAWTAAGAVLAVVFAGPVLLVAGIAAAAAMWLERRMRPDHRTDLVAWTRHLAEMVLAMYAGMLVYHAVVRPVIAALAGSGPFEGDLGYAWMVVSMVLPMGGLMIRQGHGTRMTAEMSFSMVAPTVLCFALVRLGIAPSAPFLAWLTPTTVYPAAHAAMIIGMVAATYLRRAMYGRGVIPEGGTRGPIGSSVVPASGW